MGAKTGLLVYADGDVPGLLRHVGAADPELTSVMVRHLNPGCEIEESEGSDLYDGVYPPDGATYAASWPGVDIVCDRRVMIDSPSQLPEHLVAASAGRRLVLHAMHSVVDWLAFAVWEDGRLIRSLSLSPDHGIIENIGEPLSFELPYWGGDRPATSFRGRARKRSRTHCPSILWSSAKTRCVRSAASSRRACRSRGTSTRRTSNFMASSYGIRTAPTRPRRKRRCAEQWKRWDRRGSTRWDPTAC